MSYADTLFIAMCKDIIENGYSTEGEKVRPKWEDGSYAYTLKRFGIINRYDLSKEFPAITSCRKTYIRSAIDEILWIWQKKSNNVHDLNSHIWDSWADEDGSIGKAYGLSSWGVKHQYKEGEMDQVDRVLFDLKNNPYSRRIHDKHLCARRSPRDEPLSVCIQYDVQRDGQQAECHFKSAFPGCAHRRKTGTWCSMRRFL